jgi:hypothetical protein
MNMKQRNNVDTITIYNFLLRSNSFLSLRDMHDDLPKH